MFYFRLGDVLDLSLWFLTLPQYRLTELFLDRELIDIRLLPRQHHCRRQLGQVKVEIRGIIRMDY